MKKIFFLFLLIFACMQSAKNTFASGLESNPAGKFLAKVFISNNDRFIANWQHTLPTEPPYIESTKTAQINQQLTAAVIVSGMKANEAGDYDISINLRFLKPDGSVMFEQKDYAQSNGKLPSKTAFVMADPALTIVLEANDPKGTYTLEAEVLDKIALQKTISKYQITLQ